MKLEKFVAGRTGNDAVEGKIIGYEIIYLNLTPSPRLLAAYVGTPF